LRRVAPTLDVGRAIMADNPSHLSRVLLVEDEFLICELLAEVLSEYGFEVHAVCNAQDALRHLTGGHPCDLLFTDINLPGGVDGAALAEIARQLRPNLPVVYASGSVRRIEQFKAVPGASFVPKPYDLDKVCCMLRECAAQTNEAVHS
jgi:CheY-like chemotaxis protein